MFWNWLPRSPRIQTAAIFSIQKLRPSGIGLFAPLSWAGSIQSEPFKLQQAALPVYNALHLEIRRDKAGNQLRPCAHGQGMPVQALNQLDNRAHGLSGPHRFQLVPEHPHPGTVRGPVDDGPHPGQNPGQRILRLPAVYDDSTHCLSMYLACI